MIQRGPKMGGASGARTPHFRLLFANCVNPNFIRVQMFTGMVERLQFWESGLSADVNQGD